MLNEKGFNAAIKTIKGTGEKLAEAIHDAGLFALSQANEHGNIGFGVRLIEAMGKKHDVQRVMNWLIAHGKFGVSKGQVVFKKRKDIGPENYDAWLVKANDTPYWELTPQKPLIEKVNYLSMLESIVKRHSTMKKKEQEGQQVIEDNVAVVAEVAALLEKFKVNKTVQTAPTAS